MIDPIHGWNVKFKPVFIGFVLSLIFLVISYFIVARYGLRDWGFYLLIFVFALLQAGVQLAYFFHIGLEAKPRWNLMIFLFMCLIIFIIIGGSLWIMYNLNYNVMLP